MQDEDGPTATSGGAEGEPRPEPRGQRGAQGDLPLQNQARDPQEAELTKEEYTLAFTKARRRAVSALKSAASEFEGLERPPSAAPPGIVCFFFPPSGEPTVVATDNITKGPKSAKAAVIGSSFMRCMDYFLKNPEDELDRVRDCWDLQLLLGYTVWATCAPRRLMCLQPRSDKFADNAGSQGSRAGGRRKPSPSPVSQSCSHGGPGGPGGCL